MSDPLIPEVVRATDLEPRNGGAFGESLTLILQQITGAAVKLRLHPRPLNNWRLDMEKQFAKSSASMPTSSRGQKPNTSSDSIRLTRSEIEALKQDKKDALALMQRKYFPNVKLV